MKTLYIIGGTMGVGKTSVCRNMKLKLENSVFLDGDWCWDSHPFQVTEETKAMVMKNICFLLNQFISCTAYSNVIFCWVMHEQEIIDSILENVDTAADCNVKLVSLICSTDTLYKRLESDISKGMRSDHISDIYERSVNRLPLYEKLNTIKIMTDGMSIDSIADRIISL